MRQNLVDITFTPDAADEIEHALATLETRFAALVALTPAQRRGLLKMGDNSEAFCRQAMLVVQQHPGVLPRAFDLDACRRDLQALDQLRPWLARFIRLHERLADTETALGSDLMVAALDAYAFLKVAGQGEGLDNIRRELGTRFARPRRSTAAPSAPATASTEDPSEQDAGDS
jgi:hypothetical protein